MILTANISAQTFILSNLDLGTSQTEDIEVGTYYAGSFTTGASTMPWRIDSVVARTGNFLIPPDADPDGPITQFAAIYSDISNNPGTSIGSFTNAVQETGQRYRITPSSPITLSPMTTYWMVFGDAGSTHRDQSFSAPFTDSLDQTSTAGWMMGDIARRSSDGSNWSNKGGPFSAMEFGLAATIVPEPSEYVLAMVLTIGIFIFIRRTSQSAH